VRVASETSLLDVQPGDTTELVVEIVNTSEVIDGVSTRVIGLPEPSVTSSPAMLPLFPQTSGHVTLSLAVPGTHPAGQHSLTVEVISHGAGAGSRHSLGTGVFAGMLFATTIGIFFIPLFFGVIKGLAEGRWGRAEGEA